MVQTKLLTQRNVAAIGEEITHELGAQMIKNFINAYPADVKSYTIGKDIINQILAQPGVAGIKFYNAINEVGQKTLVYVGLDVNGAAILSYKSVTNEGLLSDDEGLVADRILPQDTEFDCWWDFFG